MPDILFTNNKRAEEAYKNICAVVYAESSMEDLLKLVRDYIHKGHRLLSHPLSGSVKPNENPFKSVLVSSAKGDLDLDSLRIIENCIAVTAKFPVKFKTLTDEMRADFQKIDQSLIKNAVER